jgi:hypothetical protein
MAEKSPLEQRAALEMMAESMAGVIKAPPA